MELQEALEGRFSCRKFDSKMPSRKQIEEVLMAGRLAPTACNYQPQRLYVITDQQVLKEMDEVVHCRYKAPCKIVVGYDANEAANHAKTEKDEPWCFGEIDIASVVVHMLLKAHDLGMGCCWLGAFSEKRCHEVLDIPPDIVIRAIVDLGFPSKDAKPAPMHSKRKALEETVTWL